MWQTIDSAPHDGRTIQLAFGEDWVTIGRWRGDEFPHPWEFVDRNNGALIINNAIEGVGGPTHWDEPAPHPTQGPMW